LRGFFEGRAWSEGARGERASIVGGFVADMVDVTVR
jgi:hypothetical protein